MTELTDLLQSVAIIALALAQVLTSYQLRGHTDPPGPPVSRPREDQAP